MTKVIDLENPDITLAEQCAVFIKNWYTEEQIASILRIEPEEVEEALREAARQNLIDIEMYKT